MAGFFRGEWILLVEGLGRWARGRRDDPSARLALQIVVATLPALACGWLMSGWIDRQLRYPEVIAATTLIFGLLMGWADRRGTQQKTFQDLSWTDAIAIGLAQALALVPGVSRSGVTITAAIFRKVDRASAARFSFLLGAPVTAGAVVLQFYRLLSAWNGEAPSPDLLAMMGLGGLVLMIVGIIVSALVGFLCIRYLLVYLQTRTLFPFVIYRLALGLVLLVMLWLH